MLGVRYALMVPSQIRAAGARLGGAVRRETGARLWGEKAEVPPGELFDVQDPIVSRIVAASRQSARGRAARAMRKKPESFTAYDCTLRGLHVINSLDVKTFFVRAISSRRWRKIPIRHAGRVGGALAQPLCRSGLVGQPRADRAKAVELAAKAIELDAQNALALATHGHLRSFLFQDYDSALTYLGGALAACPSHSLAWMLSVPTLSYVGRAEEAIRHGERALRLSPSDRGGFSYYSSLSLAHYAGGSYEEAAKWGRLSMNENPLYTSNLRYLSAALAALDKIDEAQAVAAQLLRQEPEFRISTYSRTRQPFRHPEISARVLGSSNKGRIARVVVSRAEHSADRGRVL